jgi:L-rhamnose isomerase
MSERKGIEKAYEAARQRYAELGVDTEKAIERLAKTAISLHCWQGDDVGGFETSEGLSGGGLVVSRQGTNAR